MIGQPLAFYEGYHICLLFVVVEEKIISEKIIMRCNTNLHWDIISIIKVGLISSTRIESFH